MKQNFEKVLSKKAVDELAGDLNDWFNRYCYELFDCKTHEWLDITKFAKYWVAKEMAKTIFKETLLWHPPWGLTHFPYLAQVLKKEWFR